MYQRKIARRGRFRPFKFPFDATVFGIGNATVTPTTDVNDFAAKE